MASIFLNNQSGVPVLQTMTVEPEVPFADQIDSMLCQNQTCELRGSPLRGEPDAQTSFAGLSEHSHNYTLSGQNEISLQQRIDAVLNEIFGEIEAELDADVEPTIHTKSLESVQQEPNIQEDEEYDGYDEYDEYDRYYASEEEEESCVCNYTTCQGDCGTLSCGCIDVCRGHCGKESSWW